MKVNWILAAALACASSMGTAVAVQAGEAYRVYSVSDAREAKSVAAELDESASDTPPPAENEIKSEGLEGDVLPTDEEDCPRWFLFNQERCNGIKAHGWLNGGYFANSHNTTSKYNGPTTFADRSDGQINQVYGILEKPLSGDECSWDIGGRLDVLYGSDWIYNTEQGWETTTGGDLLSKWNSNPYYGLVTTQMYAELGRGDLSVKVGRFYTPIGYEVVTAPNNFFATHAYTMQYGEPFSHSGALATYKYSDNWTFLGGAVNGWDRFDGVPGADRIAGLGGAIYTPDHGKYTITLTGISGTEPTVGSPVDAFSTRNLYSLVFSYNVTDKLNYVFQHDNGWQQNALNRGQDAEWYGINQYLFYTINDCWKAGIRAEWFRDDDGVRVAGVRPGNLATGDAGNATTGALVGATPGGYAGNFYEVSAGLNWTPHANLIVRPEVRYDWYDGVGNPFGDSTSQAQWVGGFDAIVLW